MKRELFLIVSVIAGVPLGFAQEVPASVLASRDTQLGSDQRSFVSQGMCSGDFNNDGIRSLFYLSSSGEGFVGSVIAGRGDGTFEASTLVLATAQIPFAKAVVCGDVNKDGKLDLVILGGATTNTVFTFLGDGSNKFRLASTTIVPGSASAVPPFLLVADFNADKIIDVASGNSILLGDGAGGFTAKVFEGGPAIVATDLNQDGKADLVTRNSGVSSSFSVRLGRGDGTFGAPLDLGSVVEGFGYCFSGDFNGDGIPDLVLTNQTISRSTSVEILILLGAGDGTFHLGARFLGPSGPVYTADFNQDGKLDLQIANTILLGKGDGSFSAPLAFWDASFCMGSLCSASLASTVIDDFNGDGLPDIALAYQISFAADGGPLRISVVLNGSPGDGITVPGVSAATGTAPVSTGSLVTAYGVNMAAFVEQSLAGMPSTELGGIRVHIGTELALLYYVSPRQINYVLPKSAGVPIISIERVGSPYIAKGILVPVSLTTPGLFTVNSSGLAAATATRVTASGIEYVPTSTCVADSCTPVPIDLSAGSVYLSLFGTGFSVIDGKFAPYVTSCNGSPTSYFGPQLVFPGLDQVNWLLPSNLASGKYAVSCRIQGSTASPSQPNTVYVVVQ